MGLIKPAEYKYNSLFKKLQVENNVAGLNQNFMLQRHNLYIAVIVTDKLIDPRI